MRPLLVIVVAAALAGCVPPPTRDTAADGPTIEQRVETLERRVQRLDNVTESGQMVELMTRVDALHAELRELRGQLESLGNDSESLGRRQRELYLDLDRRLQAVEAGGRPASGAAAATSDQPLRLPADGDQRGEYDAAFRLLQQGRYPAAIEAFQAYLERYPNGDYADNAQYWLGEAYYVTRDYPTALNQFSRLVDSFPGSQKLPDAMLKIGYVHYELEQWDQARAVLEDVSRRAAGTTVARLAEQRLQRMRQEGR